jgi:hypothetical protein
VYLVSKRISLRSSGMKINSFQPDPVEWREDQNAEPGALANPCSTQSKIPSSLRLFLSGAFIKICARFCAWNARLASYYQLCGRNALAASDFEPRVVPLGSNSVMRFMPESQVRSIEIRAGTVWLTSTPARGDVILQRGDCFDFCLHWPFVVQAIGDATMILHSTDEARMQSSQPL